MKLTDSYGREKDTEPVLLTDEAIEKYVEMGMSICPDFDVEVDNARNTVSYSRTMTYPATDFHDAEECTLTLTVFFNPCDSDVCKVEYYETDKDGIQKKMADDKHWLRDSIICEELVPEIGSLMEVLIEECDLRNKDGSSYDKTVYAMINELPFKYEDIWNAYSEIRKLCGKCRYDRNEGKITADSKEYFIRGSYVLHNGEVFDNIKDAFESEKTSLAKENPFTQKDTFAKIS